LVVWFWELASARQGNGFGGNPISYSEIKSWAELTRRAPNPFEVDVLRRIDAAILALMNEQGND